MMPSLFSTIPGVEKSQIDTPALLIDLDAMEFNMKTMASFFQGTRTSLRPHFKTHKTPVLAHMQLQAGAIGMTCAKVGEAEVLVNAGIDDILIANQIIGPQKIARLASLARQTRITVAVDSEENIRDLSAGSQVFGSLIHVVIEIDVGLGRCGVPPGERAVALARLISGMPGLAFAGLLGYEGQAVFLNDRKARQEAVDQAMHKLVSTADLLRQAGFVVEIVSAGGTGTYDLTGRYPGITEVEAGSYILMDTRYRQVGLPFRCALTLLATVISIPARGRAVIDAGKKALTVENGLPEISIPAGARLVNLNEEHGILEVDPDRLELKVGDKVEIIPSHVCTTVNLHEVFYAIRENRLVATWPISARGKFT
jgi:D-serine deaminase-like pyridoxal phosphate-dependent protein